MFFRLSAFCRMSHWPFNVIMTKVTFRNYLLVGYDPAGPVLQSPVPVGDRWYADPTGHSLSRRHRTTVKIYRRPTTIMHVGTRYRPYMYVHVRPTVYDVSHGPHTVRSVGTPAALQLRHADSRTHGRVLTASTMPYACTRCYMNSVHTTTIPENI